MQKPYTVRAYSKRGGFVPAGGFFTTIEEAESHVAQVLEQPNRAGAEIWQGRTMVKRFYAQV